MHLKRKNNSADYETHMNGYCRVLNFECIKEELQGNTGKNTHLLLERESMYYVLVCVRACVRESEWSGSGQISIFQPHSVCFPWVQ